MLCEKCKKNEANLHILKNINGKSTELHLCESCARETGELLSMSRFMGSFFESEAPLRVRQAAYMPANSPSDNKYAGCEDCVEDRPEYKPEGAVPPVPKSGAVKLAVLKTQLENAIEKEEFERAAELRDEIKKLEGIQEV